MAEALAVVGIVANIVQLVTFGSQVLKRLEEYQSKLGDIPEAFRHIKAELPVLLDALRQTQSAIDAGSIPDESKTALLPAVEGCKVQIKLLDEVIAKALPASSDSWARRGRKALGSLRYDAKVERITAVIRGYIQTLTYHAAASLRPSADRTSPRPTPSSTVPFRRDPDFVDSQILAEIDCKSQQSASRVALVGLGGVGKSQLAVEYSYRVREKLPDIWVFWIHASSTARFMESYRKIAERAKLPGLDKPNVDILKLVYNWLCDEANGRWMLIIDNADGLDVFTTRSDGRKNMKDEIAPALLDFLPQSPNGSILITSRSRDVAFRLTGNYADIIKVHPMDQAHALTLLGNKIEGSFEQDDAIALVEALDYMPLAISQAAAYISQRAPRATVSKYLQDLRKSDRDRAKLLDMDIGDSRRDGTASNSVIATWQISFEHIRQVRPSATRLLSLMSLFDRHNIPESLLNGRYQEGYKGGHREDSDTNTDFDDDLNTLMTFSLVSIDVDGHHFEMHRLVQFSTRNWLELQGDLEFWKQKYVWLMEDSYPIGTYENWKVCQKLFPHAQAAMACRPTDGVALNSWANLLYKTGWYASETGNYQVAEEMARGAWGAKETYLGAGHPETLHSVNSVGLELSNQGKYKEAEAMFRQTLEGYKKVLDPENKEIFTCTNNLGLAFFFQGKYEAAEAMYRQALEGYTKLLGPADPYTLTTLCNIGRVLTKQGKVDEAEVMHRRVLELRQEILGPEHPDTLNALADLGRVLANQGKDKVAEAEAISWRVLEAKRRVLGPDHPILLDSINDIGPILSQQGKFKEEEVIYRQALEKSTKVRGLEHPHTLIVLHNLASVLYDLKDHDQAFELMEKCAQLREKVLGSQHPYTIDSQEMLNTWRTDKK